MPLLPLFATFWATADPKIIKILIYDYHILLGVNSYVYNDEESNKSDLNFIRTSGVPLFATFWATADPKIIKILIYGYHIFLGVNSYVYDAHKSIKRCFNFIRPCSVPLFATFWATADPKIIEILIYGYHTVLGVNSYVYDDVKSIKIYLIFIRLSDVPLFATFCYFLSECRA